MHNEAARRAKEAERSGDGDADRDARAERGRRRLARDDPALVVGLAASARRIGSDAVGLDAAAGIAHDLQRVA